MKAFLIEDEPVALRNLTRLLEKHFPEIAVDGTAATVEDAVQYLEGHSPDLIFMDVQLSDGLCFDIFLQADVTCPVVITTAYDRYALKAFEAGSVDFLVKPIDGMELCRAVTRCLHRSGGDDASRILEAMLSGGIAREEDSPALRRILVRVGGKIYPLKTEDIALVYSEQKSTFLLTVSGDRYLVNPSLDELGSRLDPERFFRVSRSCIVSRRSIRGVQDLPGGRYALDMDTPAPFPVEVSRGRANDFSLWYNSHA